MKPPSIDQTDGATAGVGADAGMGVGRGAGAEGVRAGRGGRGGSCAVSVPAQIESAAVMQTMRDISLLRR